MPYKGNGEHRCPRWDYGLQKMVTKSEGAILTPEDFVPRGKMNQEMYLDYIIDVETLSADEFINKHCY